MRACVHACVHARTVTSETRRRTILVSRPRGGVFISSDIRRKCVYINTLGISEQHGVDDYRRARIHRSASAAPAAAAATTTITTTTTNTIITTTTTAATTAAIAAI